MDQTRNVSSIVALAVSALLLIALGYTVNVIVSPFVLAGSVLYLLYPFRQDVLPRRVMMLAAAFFFLWFFYSLLGVLLPFIISFLFAYILNPFVTRLDAKRFPRWASSLVAVLLMLGVVTLAILFIVPPAARQFQSLLAGAALIAQDVSALMKSGKLFDFLTSFGVDVTDAQKFITEQLSPRIESILKTLFETLFGFMTGASSIMLQLMNIILVPFLFFYFLKDFPSILSQLGHLARPDKRGALESLGRQVDEVLGRYFRGAIVVAIIQGAIATIGLSIIGVNYALVLGIMTGILDFIPYVGLIISLVVSSIVALMSGEPVLTKVLAVVILFLSQKLLEAVFLGPKIIGTKVGLHPVALILSLMVFGYFLGFIGMLIAVPATALLLTAFNSVTGAVREKGGRE
jgi:predicted PurR-regulated permease PerM